MIRGLALAVAMGLLAACANPFDPFEPTYEELVGAGWIGPEVAARPEPIYCYRTLAEPDCFRAPQTGEQGRLVGFAGPAPY